MVSDAVMCHLETTHSLPHSLTFRLSTVTEMRSPALAGNSRHGSQQLGKPSCQLLKVCKVKQAIKRKIAEKYCYVMTDSTLNQSAAGWRFRVCAGMTSTSLSLQATSNTDYTKHHWHALTYINNTHGWHLCLDNQGRMQNAYNCIMSNH